MKAAGGGGRDTIHGVPPLRVAQVNYAYDAELQAPESLLARYTTLTGWSEAIAAAGASAIVVQRFPRQMTLERQGIAYHFTPSPSRYLVEQKAVDLVHINGLIFAGRVRWLRQRVPSATAIALQDHGSLPPVSTGLRGRLRAARWRRAMSAADGFLFAAPEQGDAWRHAGMIGAAQFVGSVMEASSTFEPQPNDRARRACNVTGSPAILWVGRLNDNKDPLTVLQAFERASVAFPASRLDMIYDSAPLLSAVQARVASSEALRTRVRLLGRVAHHQLPERYSAADLFVFGSHHEACGFAAIEACACGLWPVVTDIPSMRAITGNGAIGTLWSPGDAVGCADALVHAASTGSAGRRTAVRAHFDRTMSWPVVGRRAVEIYREIVARRRGSAIA